MSIDTNRVMAFFGISGYGPGWRAAPGRLGWKVATEGYRQLYDVFFGPLIDHCGVTDIILHKPFPDAGGSEISLHGPIDLIAQMPGLHDTYVDLIHTLQRSAGMHVIEYHGAATQLKAATSGSDLWQKAMGLDIILGVAASPTGVSRIFDMASALKFDDPMSLVIMTLHAARGARTQVYIEQRRRIEQPWFEMVPTCTMYSELLRQQSRGGEPSLAEFNPEVENIVAIDVPPPDRDPTESWDPWIVDQVQALQAEPHNFTVAVPIHSMVRRKRWDLLQQIFGEPT